MIANKIREISHRHPGSCSENCVAKPGTLPPHGLTEPIAQVKKRCRKLTHRYGPRYTNAMLGAAFFTFFLPIPGSLLIGVALIVVIAEVHRAISKRGDVPEAIANLVVFVKANTPCWAMGGWRAPRSCHPQRQDAIPEGRIGDVTRVLSTPAPPETPPGAGHLASSRRLLARRT
jgi:hypothetical protein